MEKLNKSFEDYANFVRGIADNRGFLPAEKIKIVDDTLCGGEQMPGVALSPKQKLDLAILLSEIGADVLNIGFPGIYPGDRSAVQLAAIAQKEGRIREDVEILAACGSRRADIDAVRDALKEIGARADSVGVSVISAFSHLTELVEYARSDGFSRIEFNSEDIDISDMDYTADCVNACIKAGGTRFCFSDRMGVFTPEAVDCYVPKMVELCGDIEFHARFSNNFGLGAANAVRALTRGAAYVGVAANGIGECAGNVPLHQVVMILNKLYGIRLPRVKFELLAELRRRVERYTGITVQPHEPIIGEGIFAYESGMRQFVGEQEVGGKKRFVFGKHSGIEVVEYVLYKNKNVLESAGVKITKDLINNLLNEVKNIRNDMIGTNHAAEIVKQNYRAYGELGISEDKLVELAVRKAGKKVKVKM